MTFVEVMANPKGRELVEQIEELVDEKEEALVRIRERLIRELKEKFGYQYRINDSSDSDLTMLSLEEEKAIADYKKAISNTKDPKLLRLYAHILNEEIEHLEELQSEEVQQPTHDSITKKEYKSMFTKKEISNIRKLRDAVDTCTKDRLAPSQYSALRKLGYNEQRWKNMTSEQASRIIAQAKAKREKQSGPEKTTQPKGKKEGQTEVLQQKSASSSQEEGKKQLAQFKKDFEHYFDDYWTALETGKRSDNPKFASWSEMKEADIDLSEYKDVKAEYEYLTKKAAGTLTPEEETKHQVKQQREIKTAKRDLDRSQKSLDEMKQILADPEKRKQQAKNYEGKPLWKTVYVGASGVERTADTDAGSKDEIIDDYKRLGLKIKSMSPISNKEYLDFWFPFMKGEVQRNKSRYESLKKKYGVSDSIKRGNKDALFAVPKKLRQSRR